MITKLRGAAAAVLVMAAASIPASAAPVRLIYDTDMQTDCDDAAALAALHALADLGEVEILATMVGVLNPWSAPCTDAINTYYGRPHLPLGQLKGSDGVNITSLYTQGVAEGFPQDTGSAAQAPDAAPAYRQILANEPDGSVVILSVGYMTNLAKLLNSPPDEISPLTGAQLIQQKVKTWICMGGNFPDDFANNSNVNFRRHPASVIDCVTNWPGPVVFVGREIGHSMRAGARLAQTSESNPVRRAYELFFKGPAKDQHCADIAAILYAVRGLKDYWDLESTGSIQFTDAEARFKWVTAPDRNQAYLLQKMPPATIQELLEDLMVQPPGGGQPRPSAAILSPAVGQRFDEGEQITITAAASDPNGSIAKVEFFDGFKKIGERTAPPFAITYSSAAIGQHPLSVKVTDNEHGSSISAPVRIRIGFINEGNGRGLTGEYFDNADLTNQKLTRLDESVEFNWGSGSPDAAIGNDSFSVRWTGAVLPTQASGKRLWTFYTNTNDGVRLWVNDQLLIDDWTNGPLREKSGSIELEAGRLHAIRMEFFENTNTAQAELMWASDGVTKQIIPKTQLFPTANQPPLAVNDSATTDQDLPVAIPVLANDSDPDLAPVALAIESVSGGVGGSRITVSGKNLVYHPAPGFLGTDSFSYTATDGQNTASAQVSVLVRPWSTYEAFRRKHFTPEQQADPAVSGWEADPDSDGASNGIEYSQLTDPTAPDPSVLSALTLRDDHLVLTFQRRKAALDHECHAEVSADLMTWNTGPAFLEEAVIQEDEVRQVIEARDLTPASSAGRRFIRLKLEPM